MEPTIDEHRSQCCCQFLKCGTRCDFESSADEDKILRQNFIDYVEVVWRIPKLLPESKNELDRGVWVQVRLPIYRFAFREAVSLLRLAFTRTF